MFESLDDPTPFRPTERLRASVTARGRRLRLRRRLTAAAGATTLALCSVTAGAALYVDRRDDAIDRVEIAAPPSLDGGVNVLLIGSDARAGDEAREVPGQRADTIVVVRAFPDGHVGLLSLPRDLVIPGTGSPGTPLSAHLDGGPQQLVDTVVAATGLPIDHYVALDMAGLVDVVDAVGGLDVFVGTELRDRSTGLDLGLGCQTLDGDTALALVRSRHVEGDPSSDLGRMARARALLTVIGGEVRGAASDPVALDRLTRALADHATLDDGLTLGRLAELARAGAATGSTEAEMLPVAEASGDSGRLQMAPRADAVLRAYGATNPPAVPPSAAPAGTAPLAEEASPVLSPC